MKALTYQDLETAAELFVRDLFDRYSNPLLVFHNLNHTRAVVNRVDQISRYYPLKQREQFIIKIAAWFHDTGYLNGAQADHEQRGADFAKQFLAEHGQFMGCLAEIQDCILVTKMPQKPDGLLQEILCDADLFHFGTLDFFECDNLMREESESNFSDAISIHQWQIRTVELLKAHQYHTAYCQQHLNRQKADNLGKLESMLGRC